MTVRMLRFQAAVVALFYLSTQSVVAFTTTTATTIQYPYIGTPTTKTQLSAVPAAVLSSTSSARHLGPTSKRRQGQNHKDAINNGNRPSDEEQMDYLRKAVEFRRLKALKQEIMTMGSSSCTRMASSLPENHAATTTTTSRFSRPKQVSTLHLAQAAGYGDDIVAYEQAWEQGIAAREALVTRNMGLVYYCVNEIMGGRSRRNTSHGNSDTTSTATGSRRRLQSLSREDLIQEGAIGLARAVDKWNPAIGGKFSTYAVYWVRAAILRGIAERDDLVRVPEHVSAAVRKVTKAAAQLGINIDGENWLSSVYGSSSRQYAEANWKEAQAAKALAEQAGLTQAQLATALQVRERRNQGVASFEAWMQKGRDLDSDTALFHSAGGTVQDNDDENMAGSSNTEFLRQELSRFLRPKEMEALSWRYGLLLTKTTTAEITASESSSAAAAGKNYLARAEQELFGSATTVSKASNTIIPPSQGGRWGEAMSFQEVGQRMQVSAEYGRRLCHAALTKLRRAAEDGNLSPSLLAL